MWLDLPICTFEARSLPQCIEILAIFVYIKTTKLLHLMTNTHTDVMWRSKTCLPTTRKYKLGVCTYSRANTMWCSVSVYIQNAGQNRLFWCYPSHWRKICGNIFMFSDHVYQILMEYLSLTDDWSFLLFIKTIEHFDEETFTGNCSHVTVPRLGSGPVWIFDLQIDTNNWHNSNSIVVHSKICCIQELPIWQKNPFKTFVELFISYPECPSWCLGGRDNFHDTEG